MAEIVEVNRESTVLKRPTLPCLSRYHTINLTAGCLFGCRYCYAQSFRSYPGRGKVLFYADTYELLRTELLRKRKIPVLVYFSTACEPFLPDEHILSTLYRVMKLLLEHSVFILISTKSHVPHEFVELLAEHPDCVHVQVGITTVNDRVRQVMEPNAPTVDRRFDTLHMLVEHGVRTEVRIDPLIPELTDTDESFVALCAQMQQAGAKRAVTSYLFLRRANIRPLDVTIGKWSFRDVAQRVYTHRIEKYCSGGCVSVPTPEYREKKYERLRTIAAEHGISVGLCGCKNPDVTTECCHPQPPTTDTGLTQTTLF